MAYILENMQCRVPFLLEYEYSNKGYVCVILVTSFVTKRWPLLSSLHTLATELGLVIGISVTVTSATL